MSTEVHNASRDASVGQVDVHLEVDIIPVSDVERSKEFYERLGWRLDDDVAPLDGLRIVQYTPPGSGASITFGKGLTSAAPGSAEGGLTVSDIEAAHDELVGRGIDASDVWHGPPFPARGAAARPRPRAHQLWVVLLLQRSRRQCVARPGGHDTAPGPRMGGLKSTQQDSHTFYTRHPCTTTMRKQPIQSTTGWTSRPPYARVSAEALGGGAEACSTPMTSSA